MGSLGMVELRFTELRERLDVLGYRQPLSIESLPLAEKLLADLLQTTDSLKAAKEQIQKDQEDAESRACVEPYRQDNGRLCQELSALRLEAIKSREKFEENTKGLRAEVRRLEDENEDLRFLSGQYKKQADAAEQRLFSVLEKQNQPVASVTVTGGGGGPRRQRMELSSQLSSASDTALQTATARSRQTSDPATIDLVSAAERRVTELEKQRDEADTLREAAEQTAHELRDKVKSREAEIRRLTDLLDGGRPYKAVLADLSNKENDMSRANLPYAELKKTNTRLEKQLKETVHSQHEAMQRALELAKKNEALRRELADLDRIVHVLEEDRTQLARTNEKQVKDEQAHVSQLEAASSRADRSESEAAAARRRTAELESELACERRRAEDAETELAAARQTADRLDALLQTMRNDRRAMQERVDHLTENEKQLVLELDRLSRQKTNTARIPDKTQKLIQSLEEQRDYFKQQVEGLLEQLQKNDAAAAESEMENQLAYFRSECRRLEEENQRLASSTTAGVRLQSDSADLRCRLSDCERQLADSVAQLDAKTNESEQLRQRLDEALRSLHRLSESESATLASTAQLEGLVRTIEQERSLAAGDCHRIEHERDQLRNKLKVATETHLSDRVKMESRVAELEALIGAAETDRSVQQSQAASHRALISSLEAQVKNLQTSLSESQTELNRLMTKNAKMKTVVDQGEMSRKDCENELIKKTGELETCLRERYDLERQCTDLRTTVDELQREARRQTKVIEHVIRERDKFQNTLDDKTELLDEHRQQLEKCNAHIVQLESTITNVTADLAASREEVSALCKELRSVRRRLEQAEAQVSSSDRHRGAVTEENRRLQDDLVTLTHELQQLRKEREEAQRLQDDLKQQVRDYVNEVARVEELLGLKEEERNDLLRQYKDLTIEASGLEETNHSLGSEVALMRAELAAKEAELSHAHDTITLLNDDIQQTSVARQQADVSVSRLNESVSELEARLQRCEADRARLDRELAACRELNMKLETQRETMTRQLADKSRDLDTVRSELRAVQSELEAVRQQLTSERASAHDLETLLTSARGRQYEADVTSQQQTAELAQMSERLNTLQNKLEAQKVETGLYRSQAAERDLEVERLKRQMVGERFEKERLSQELRRLRRETVVTASYGAGPAVPAAAAPAGRSVAEASYTVTTESSAECGRLSGAEQRAWHSDPAVPGAAEYRRRYTPPPGDRSGDPAPS